MLGIDTAAQKAGGETNKHREQRITALGKERDRIAGFLASKNGKLLNAKDTRDAKDELMKIDLAIATLANEMREATASAAEQEEADRKENAKQAEEDRRAAEHLRREALGLDSLEEEEHRAALNAIRAQHGLAPLVSDSPVATGGAAAAGGTTAGATGATGGGVVIKQYFSSEPDMFAASRLAAFAYRTAGLA